MTVEHPEESIEKLVELKSKLRKIVGYKVSVQN